MKNKKNIAKIAAALSLILAAAIVIPSLNTAEAATSAAPSYTAEELFTKRDLEQEPDTDDATYYELKSGQDIHITAAGVYVITGSAAESTIYVEAGDDDKVQIVLSGASIANTSFPCIYVKDADKVFVTTSGDSSLSVSGTFKSDGNTNTDGAIFSKCDLTLNGTATLTISSAKNGVAAKDDLKITGGHYIIKAQSKCFEANDSIRVSGGTFELSAGTDALHSESDDEDKGYIYISGGSFTIKAGDDGIHASSIVQIDGGSITITAGEGIEGTFIRLNDGTVTINATDDGINAAQKIRTLTPTVEINGGALTVSVSQGDTDCIDSNGDIIINGGTVYCTGNSTFDYDGSGVINGGSVYANGSQITTLPNQFMGGMGGHGGWGGQGGKGSQGGQGGGWGGQGGWGWGGRGR